MSEIIYGTCKFCGQCNWDLDCSECLNTDEAIEKATESCECDEAVKYTTLRKKYTSAKAHVDDLFGKGCKEKEIEPASTNVLTYLYTCAERVVNSDISAVTVNIARGCQAKISASAKGQIKVERTETEKYQQQE